MFFVCRDSPLSVVWCLLGSIAVLCCVVLCCRNASQSKETDRRIMPTFRLLSGDEIFDAQQHVAKRSQWDTYHKRVRVAQSHNCTPPRLPKSPIPPKPQRKLSVHNPKRSLQHLKHNSVSHVLNARDATHTRPLDRTTAVQPIDIELIAIKGTHPAIYPLRHTS